MIRTQTAGTTFTLAVAAMTAVALNVAEARPQAVKPWSVSVHASTYAERTLNPEDDLHFETWPEASNRLLFLLSLGPNHDGAGGAAPHRESFVTALSFVRQLTCIAPEPRVGMGGDGMAVVEFHEGDDLAQIVFLPGREVEFYYSRPGAAPQFDEGSMDDPAFLSSFHSTFGFQLVA